MGRYLDLCETVEVDAIEPAHPRDISDKSDQSPPTFEVPGVKCSVIEGGRNPATPAEWIPQDWVDHFEERAAIIEHDGELPGPEAEQLAFEDTISLWQFRHPPEPTDDVVCVHCDAALDDDAIPVLAGDSGHVWLHGRCHPPWLAKRRTGAEQALAAMGVAAAIAQRSHSG